MRNPGLYILVLLLSLAFREGLVAGEALRAECIVPPGPLCNAGCTTCRTLRVASFAVQTEGVGDPEFVGLDGRKFKFDGVPDEVFNLITEKNHQVNALFVEGLHGTWIGSMGLLLYGNSIEIETNTLGDMTVVVNGANVTLNDLNGFEEVYHLPKSTVTVNRYKPQVGQAVTVETELYTLLIFATPEEMDNNLNLLRGHLNMQLAIDPAQYHLADVHGVLGQINPDTASDSALLPPNLRDAFLGEGVDTDYIVSGLLGIDFQYNRYLANQSSSAASGIGTQQPAGVNVARRALVERSAFLEGKLEQTARKVVLGLI